MAFRTVVVDPPWPMRRFNGWGSARELPYRPMSLDGIRALPIPGVVGKEGYLFLWTPDAFLDAAVSIISAWGFTRRQTVVWTKDGVPRMGLGGMFATSVEFCLVAQKIRPGTNAHGSRTMGVRAPASHFAWPLREHSEKPAEFYILLETLSPGPYLDVFARVRRPGWVAVGDAIDGQEAAISLRSLSAGCPT